MIRESQRSGQVHGVLNSNFICLIPTNSRLEPLLTIDLFHVRMSLIN
jgi:hypothetical protein